MEYRSSYSFPIKFPCLPVRHMSVQLEIPLMQTIREECGNHGHCLKYPPGHEKRKTLFLGNSYHKMIFF